MIQLVIDREVVRFAPGLDFPAETGLGTNAHVLTVDRVATAKPAEPDR